MSRPLVLPLTFGLLAALACAGPTPECDDDEELVDGECEKEEDPFADADTDADTDADSDADSDTDTDTDTDTDSDTDTDTDTDSDTDTDVPTTIADAQRDGYAGAITFTDVVVTSGLSTDGGSFFVQDAGGGAWAGLRVYIDGFAGLVHPGDIVTVSGSLEEYYAETELIAVESDLSFDGTTRTPSVTTLRSIPSDWEQYEGVLVRVEDITLLSPPDTYGQVTTDWGIIVDDFLYTGSYSTGVTYASITGVVRYNFDEWKLCPRNGADIAL